MKNVHPLAALALLALGVQATSASSMSFQAAPRNSDGSSQLVDPDEQAEHAADVMQRNDQRLFAHRALSSNGLIERPGDRTLPAMNVAPAPQFGPPY